MWNEAFMYDDNAQRGLLQITRLEYFNPDCSFVKRYIEMSLNPQSLVLIEKYYKFNFLL